LKGLPKEMKRELVFTKKESEEIIPFPNQKLADAIKERYDFEIGYSPEGFNACFLLVEDNKEDSRKDVWKIVFFKEAKDIGDKTITLDNMDDLDATAETSYEFFKELDGNFEDVINISVDLIKKFYEDIKNETTV
jgi:hypothetical protein